MLHQRPYEKCQHYVDVDITEKGSGHYQIFGLITVNHYPFSKNMTAYISGCRKGAKNITQQMAIDMALHPDQSTHLSPTKRKGSYKQMVNKMYKRGCKCGICGVKFKCREEATLDHRIPLSKGGANKRCNYQLAHGECNRIKGNSILSNITTGN